MKRTIIFIIAALLVVVSAVSCNKKKRQDKNVSVVGEWVLNSFSGLDAASTDIEVYVSFKDDKSFELYQKLGGGHFAKFTGSYSVAGSVLSGKYTDGSSWGSSYKVSVADGQLTLESLDTKPAEVCIYLSESIPASVKQDAAEYSETRASSFGACPWL